MRFVGEKIESGKEATFSANANWKNSDSGTLRMQAAVGIVKRQVGRGSGMLWSHWCHPSRQTCLARGWPLASQNSPSLGRPRALTGSSPEISLPVRFVRWFVIFTDFRVSIALCALEFLKFPHMFRRSPDSGAPASIHQLLHIIHIHVRFADIPAWLASTPRPLASFARERRLRRRFHRAFERQAVPRHHRENPHDERQHGSPGSQWLGSGDG